MEKVRPWCGQHSDRGRLMNRTEQYLQRAAYNTFQTCILNSHQGHAMCRSMAGIQSTAAEIRRGKKKRQKEEGKKLQGKNIMAPLLHRAAINSIVRNICSDSNFVRHQQNYIKTVCYTELVQCGLEKNAFLAIHSIMLPINNDDLTFC